MLYGKYKSDGVLKHHLTGDPIPEDEPVFILRAKDKHAVRMLTYYMRCCAEKKQAQHVQDIVRMFKEFRDAHPEVMKEPD